MYSLFLNPGLLMHFIDDFKSNNFNERPKSITHIVLHYTDLASAEESLKVLCDPNSKVSAHFLIDDNGDIYGLIDCLKRAWHAGVSNWEGIDNVNDFSIGIELQNKGHSTYPLEPYPKIQMESLIKLLQFLTTKYGINPLNVIGHSDIAPLRKKDPGEHFDWNFLKAYGFGIDRTLY
ncbi:MAG: N-acetylmuramoyl-L-alanine amidase [Proteobacteria bacterium]|nr:N-acetylmuramoyl-L-alanine amidase [Pseudomonadota bacterium]